FGLSHYEGRGWRGFHHHATLCIAAYGFLLAERLKQDGSKKNSTRSKIPSLPQDYIPRGSPARATPPCPIPSPPCASCSLATSSENWIDVRAATWSIDVNDTVVLASCRRSSRHNSRLTPPKNLPFPSFSKRG